MLFVEVNNQDYPTIHPLELATPFPIKLKFLTKPTLSVNNPGDWESVFPTINYEHQSCKKPRLVGFWDRSSQAFSAAIYAVTMVSKSEEYNLEDLGDRDYDPKEHDFISHLVAAKARVTPLKTGLTIPRSKLSGLLLCTRLCQNQCLYIVEVLGQFCV